MSVHPGVGTGLVGRARDLCRIDRTWEWQATDTSACVVDWDGDGLLDLLVGTRHGVVLWLRNAGSRTAPNFGKYRPVALQSGTRDLKVDAFAAPSAGDWDGDGDLDLVVGDFGGDVRLYRNTDGKLGLPEDLVARGDDPLEGPQQYAHPLMTDWDADGRLDLLVGDQYLERRAKPELTPAELEELDALREEARLHEDTLYEARSRIGKETCFALEMDGGELWKADEATRARFQKALDQALDEDQGRTNALFALEGIRERIARLDPPARQHGRVWLYLRERR